MWIFLVDERIIIIIFDEKPCPSVGFKEGDIFPHFPTQKCRGDRGGFREDLSMLAGKFWKNVPTQCVQC